uniref:Uncharacterized protein n=1 Tax=Setaria viridis TaxID=4556 RepID=A0A4U6T872_SETVI|nr:hypothetical protein SEVIR_9G426466v2 [Setaria viridis]
MSFMLILSLYVCLGFQVPTAHIVALGGHSSRRAPITAAAGSFLSLDGHMLCPKLSGSSCPIPTPLHLLTSLGHGGGSCRPP